jgi:hypothetical protein
MKFAVQIMLGLSIALLTSLVLLTSMVARADDLALSGNSYSGNPYDSIVARNIFSLVPMPTNPPDTKPPDPPAKITPNGIMSLFGQLQVLFKVATPPKPGQPPQDQSYVMSEGDRQDGIAVTKIDEQAGMITFDNHGVIQTLALTSASDASSSATGGPSGSTPDQQVHRFRGGRFGRAPDLSGGGANPNNTPSYGSPPANVNNNSDRITPEAQVILMEAQRQQFQQAGDPAAAIIPTTPLTQELQDDNNNNPNNDPSGPTVAAPTVNFPNP